MVSIHLDERTRPAANRTFRPTHEIVLPGAMNGTGCPVYCIEQINRMTCYTEEEWSAEFPQEIIEFVGPPERRVLYFRGEAAMAPWELRELA